MNDDDEIAMIPAGHRFEFWMVVVGKFIAQTGELSANENLRVLEALHELAEPAVYGGAYITKETLAMIEPASRAVFEIYDAASKLDDPAKPSGESYRVLTCAETFGILLKLNPSVLKAIRYMQAKRASGAVKVDANGAVILATASSPNAGGTPYVEPQPDPHSRHISDDWVRRSPAPQYARGSVSHRDGEFDLFTGR